MGKHPEGQEMQDFLLGHKKDFKILHRVITVIFLLASASALFFQTLRPRVQDLLFDIRGGIRGYTPPKVGDTQPEVRDTRPAVPDTRPEVGDTRPGVGDTRPEVISCDFSAYRTSVCRLEGDIRISRGGNFTVTLANSNKSLEDEQLIAQIRPYTRKFSASIMETIEQVSIGRSPSERAMKCNVTHSVPAVVFSGGGYAGNVFHAYTDGLVPLFATSAKYHGQVVFVVLQLQTWWVHKYSEILQQLSKYPIVDYDKLDQVHCFSEVVVGLNFHGDLAIDPAAKPEGNTMADFQQLLNNALSSGNADQVAPATVSKPKPRLVLIVRTRSRVLINQDKVVKLAERIGFEVKTLQVTSTTKLTLIYSLVHSADVLVGVHGAGLTHFLFMRPNTTFIQIVPYALELESNSCFGQPAKKAGLHYIDYNVLASESTLLKDYGAKHPVIANPKEIKAKGWMELRKYYLDRQNVRLSLRRLEPVLREAFNYSIKS